MDTNPDPSVGEPVIVTILFVVAYLSIVVGIVFALREPILAEGLAEIASAALRSIGFWAAAVLIRILHRIERNTRG